MITNITQTRFGLCDYSENKLPGNCFQAALASLLGLQLNDTPDEADVINKLLESGRTLKSHEDSWGHYWWHLQAWLHTSFGMQMVVTQEIGSELEEVYCLASGMSPRGLSHSCVWRGSSVVWDPHPDRTGYLGSPTSFTLIVPVSPSDIVAALNPPVKVHLDPQAEKLAEQLIGEALAERVAEDREILGEVVTHE